jgi:hypothetical protein
MPASKEFVGAALPAMRVSRIGSQPLTINARVAGTAPVLVTF